jgi:uncharacterized protein (TIGR02145 family)
MENSEKKSLISTGSSNLAKTEKLLSITKKILNEIKSTTQYESVNIGSQEWMVKNLDVDRFRNGDLVPHVVTDEEWRVAGENGQPAWCFYDNYPENGKIYGKLYNWYAVNDPRGLAPEGWHIPTDEEWTILTDFLGWFAGEMMKTVEGWKDWLNYVYEEGYIIRSGNGNNSSGFTGLPGGYRYYNGEFNGLGSEGGWWSSSEDSDGNPWPLYLHDDGDVGGCHGSNKEAGLSVRCLRD